MDLIKTILTFVPGLWDRSIVFEITQKARCVFVSRTPALAGGFTPHWPLLNCNLSWIVREIRKHYINVRFSDEELEKLLLQMRLSGYRNRSKYIRERAIAVRIQRRYYGRNEATLIKQIELLRAELKHIGVNYNQRVKALNTLAKLRDKRGRPIINAADIDRDMMQMKHMMDGMVEKVNEIYNQVNESPDSGDSHT